MAHAQCGKEVTGPTDAFITIMARILDEVVASVSTNDRWKLDKEIDFEHRDARGHVIPEHLGRIADSMTDWEGDVADNLDLSEPDRSDIRERNSREQR